jgi:hypothetical protein
MKYIIAEYTSLGKHIIPQRMGKRGPNTGHENGEK